MSENGRFFCGIDIGGTFTDCVVFERGGRLVTSKAPSTPDDFSRGFVDALSLAAAKLDLSVGALCEEIDTLTHGTTVGTNAIIQDAGAKVALLTTLGFEDTIHIMRGSRGYSGVDLRPIVHFPEGPKPKPIVPKRRIEGIHERIDCFGDVIVDLNQDLARDSILRLVDDGGEAFAICLLWAFKNSDHEKRLRDLVDATVPGAYVTCSHEIAAKSGEYERTTAAVLNSYIGPIMRSYLGKLDDTLNELGLSSDLNIAQCGGGSISVEHALKAPLLTLDSGPVAGVTASVYLAERMGLDHVISTDMGGTSFDVGIIKDRKPNFSFTSFVDQYEYFVHRISIDVIGAGGGSLVSVDERTGRLKVGPDSAGAMPGPICYGRGGKVPTVTDANVVLGYFEPSGFAEGSMTLDRDAAFAALEDIGKKIGLGAVECASAVVRIVELNMADLIRKATIEKGHDPREFSVFAFGGAGPTHAAVFSRELGAKQVVIPQKQTSSVWCAFGATVADTLHIVEDVVNRTEPFDLNQVNSSLASLNQRARELLAEEGAESGVEIQFSADIRHAGQINQVEVDLSTDQLTAEMLSALPSQFKSVYEGLYGKGSSYAGVPMEIVCFRVRARAVTSKPSLTTNEATSVVPEKAKLPDRDVYWREFDGFRSTSIYDGRYLESGNFISGPSVIETQKSSVVVHPGQRLKVDELGNLIIELETSR